MEMAGVEPASRKYFEIQCTSLYGLLVNQLHIKNRQKHTGGDLSKLLFLA